MREASYLSSTLNFVYLSRNIWAFHLHPVLLVEHMSMESNLLKINSHKPDSGGGGRGVGGKNLRGM